MPPGGRQRSVAGQGWCLASPSGPGRCRCANNWINTNHHAKCLSAYINAANNANQYTCQRDKMRNARSKVGGLDDFRYKLINFKKTSQTPSFSKKYCTGRCHNNVRTGLIPGITLRGSLTIVTSSSLKSATWSPRIIHLGHKKNWGRWSRSRCF